MAGRSLLATALDDVRTFLNDHQVERKYGNPFLLREMARAWDAVLHEVNKALGDAKIYARYPFTFAADVTDYLLPASSQSIIEVRLTDPATGDSIAWLPSFGPRNNRGMNFQIHPPFLRLETPFTTLQTAEIVYVPRGIDYMHQSPIGSGMTGSVIRPSFNPELGEFDQRPNAFVGGMIRVYEAQHTLSGIPGGYQLWPVQERWITGWSLVTGLLTVNKAWDVEPVAGGKVAYEILPMVDPALMDLAALLTAQRLLQVNRRRTGAKDLLEQYTLRRGTTIEQYRATNSVREPGAEHSLTQRRTQARPLMPYGPVGVIRSP